MSDKILDCTICIHTEVIKRHGSLSRRCRKFGFWTGDKVMNCNSFKAALASYRGGA